MLEVIGAKLLDAAVATATSLLSDAVKRKNNELLKKHEQVLKGGKGDKDAVRPAIISATLTSARTGIKSALVQHIEDIRKWCTHIKFSDLRGSKSVMQVYVELDTYLMPLSVHETPIERTQTEPLLEAIKSSSHHCALLGTAGAGKTTSMQKICADYFKVGKILGNQNFPILIQLRDLNGSLEEYPLLSALCDKLSLHANFSPMGQDVDSVFVNAIERKIVVNYLDELNAAILLDGFDELATVELRQGVIRDISELADKLSKSRIVVTSRSSDFRYKLSSIDKYEIAPLTKEQVTNFALRWLQSETRATDFLQKVFASPFADTTIRPLTIAHLCAIYERIQDIPEKPKSVYRRIVQLLLEDWDSQRQIKRPSAYAMFDHDRKFEFLAHLAYYMTVELKQLRFSRESLKDAYAKIRGDHGLPASEAMNVAAELESHSGLILESGYGHFEFAHKSIQEYLAADYIVRLPNLDLLDGKLDLLPNELAIATSLSSRPSAFLAELFLKAVDLERTPSPWLPTFLARLAMEKPELHIGASAFSAIAAMHLFARLDDPITMIELLRGAFPDNVQLLITRYYQVTSRDRLCTQFRRQSHSSTYKLPDFLQAPTELLTLTNK